MNQTKAVTYAGDVTKREIQTIQYNWDIQGEVPPSAQIELYVNGVLIRRIQPFTRPYYQLFGQSRTELDN